MNIPRIAPLVRLAGMAAVAAAMVLPSVAQTAGPSVMIFPMDKAEAVDQSVADTLTSGLRARIAATNLYDATVFNPKSPLIVRAIQGSGLPQGQTTPPFDAVNASAVAKAVGVDFAVVGSVDEAAADAAAGTAKVTVTVMMVNAATGRPFKSAGVSGTASAKGTPAASLLRLAADNAADKVAAQFYPASTKGAVAPRAAATALPTGSLPMERKHKRNNGLLVLGGLAVIGIIIAASHSGGGGGGGTSDGPPPLPF